MYIFPHPVGLKANVSEADHPLLCEGTRRQRGDLAISMLVHYKDNQNKLSKVGTEAQLYENQRFIWRLTSQFHNLSKLQLKIMSSNNANSCQTTFILLCHKLR